MGTPVQIRFIVTGSTLGLVVLRGDRGPVVLAPVHWPPERRHRLTIAELRDDELEQIPEEYLLGELPWEQVSEARPMVDLHLT